MSQMNLSKIVFGLLVSMLSVAIPNGNANANPHSRFRGGCESECSSSWLVNNIQEGNVVQVLLDSPVGTLQVGSVIEVYFVPSNNSYVTRAYSVYGEYVVTERFGGNPAGHILNIAGAIFQFNENRELYVNGCRVGRIINM